jgi:peptidoglycan/xylan/chitin deacetylase (PgdA/CDA1 family)
VIPVLMYHGLHVDQAGPGHFHPIYSVRPDTFVEQIEWLVRAGYRSTRLGDIGTTRNLVVISFDDGDVSNVDVALPLLAGRGLVAEFFVVSDYIGRSGMVGPDDGRALVEAGMGVQSHGRTHRPLEDLSTTDLEGELVESRAAIESWSGAPVDALSLPGGRGRERERTAARRLGYRYVLNSVPGTNQRWGPGEYLQRIAVTRDMTLRDFSSLVEWTGLRPRRAWARYQAFEGAKRALGNSSYLRLRALLMAARGEPLSAEPPDGPRPS